MPARERRGRKPVDWVGLAQVAAILSISSGLWLLYKTSQASRLEWERVSTWLNEKGLQQFEERLYSAGVHKLKYLVLLTACIILSSIIFISQGLMSDDDHVTGFIYRQ